MTKTSPTVLSTSQPERAGDMPVGATHMRRPEYLTAWLFDGVATMPLWLIERYHSQPLPEHRRGMYALAVDGEFWRWMDVARFEEMFMPSALAATPADGGEVLRAALMEIEEAMLMLGDVPGATLVDRVGKLISYHMGLQAQLSAAQPASPLRDHADYKLGWWLAGALEDPNVCAEMKDVINKWFEAHQPGLIMSASSASPASPLRGITDEMVSLACEVYAEVYHDDDKDMGDAMRAALKAVSASPPQQPPASYDRIANALIDDGYSTFAVKDWIYLLNKSGLVICEAPASPPEQPAADPAVCARCQGSGLFQSGNQCYRCYGTGVDPCLMPPRTET